MKYEQQYAVFAAAVMLACGAAHAQSSARTERTDDFSQSLTYQSYLKGAELRASKLVGARVRNAAGETLGEIEEIVIPTRGQDDMLVIVSVGGVLDVGDKLVALPYDDLRVSADGDTLYFDRTEAQLKAAPAFTYEGEPEGRARAERQRERDTADSATAPASTARAVDERPRTATPSATNTATVAKPGNVVLDTFDYRASDIIGATVLDDRGESVAKVDDIVVSTEDDKLHAVLAFGGFAGFGAKLISIPFDDLQITADDGKPQVRIAMTGDQLQQLVASRPEFRYERQVAQAPAAPRG
jgi:sporulation protein YlmC with PRC-barrel domain